MNILILGAGGREHAIAHSLAASKGTDRIFVAPGNGGTAAEAKTENVCLNITDSASVVKFAQENNVELVVIGPEAPLVAGVADAIRQEGIAAFGPGASGARIEGSKVFSKEFMLRNNIPTAAYFAYTKETSKQAYAKLEELGVPVVIKADGLAAGKGVTVAFSMTEAKVALKECLDGRFGQAGDQVVIEEYLEGPECSILAFFDGETMVTLSPAQDHKRIGDGDSGPNTGGMGVYSPVPFIYKPEYDAMIEIMEESGRALTREGIDYRGVLYGGFMLTEDGPKVLEFNARFGDPETQILLPRMRTDLLEIMLATDARKLKEVRLNWDLRDGVCVVMASKGYPGEPELGKRITGIDAANSIEGVVVFQAGTQLTSEGDTITSGGRVLSVTALASDFKKAIELAYKGVAEINFEGAYCRTDIGKKALLPRKEL